VYFRYTEKQRVMVILNKNDQQTPLALDRFAGMIGSARNGKNVPDGKTYKLETTLELPAKSALILELQ